MAAIPDKVSIDKRFECRVVLENLNMNSSGDSWIASLKNQATSATSLSTLTLNRSEGITGMQKDVTEQMPLVKNYEARMNEVIDRTISEIRTKYRENLIELIPLNNGPMVHYACKRELAKLRAEHAEEIVQLKGEILHYRAKMERMKRECDSAIEDAKKKQWCSSCGKGKDHIQIHFCNNECQEKYIDLIKTESFKNKK
ncbi:uncharacterized protein LOC116350423 [Contarinia nasturtii]|uniref:uncharacterized protein LOC116350423 n=1 Tax=Contarinia nasturtii TaxID=265458 RepID=UPI0012D3C188|nr:uncharacterized protein LOC116350423 [Contarinia nasturtii]